MRYLFLIGIYLFIAKYQFVIAQTDCQSIAIIKVMESDDAHHLPYSTIYNLNTKLAYYSNEKGELLLKDLCPSILVLKLRHAGYKDSTFYLTLHSGENNFELKLDHNETHLHDVEIVGERQEQALIQSNVRIQQQELFQSAGQSFGKILENVQGIVSATAGNGNAKPILHGMDGYRVLILNNGIRQEGQQWGKDHAPEIDAYLAKEIVVVKGAASLRYGSDALAGVILVNPENIEDTKAKSSVLSSFQSNGRAFHIAAHTQNTFQIKALPIAWRLQSAYKKSGNIQTPDRFLKNTGYEELDASLTLFSANKIVSSELFASLFHTQLGLYSGAFISNRTELLEFIATGKPLATDLADFSYQIDRPSQKVNHVLIKNKWHIHTGHHSALDMVMGYQNNRRQEFDKFRPRSGNPEFDYNIQTFTADVTHNWQILPRWQSLIGGNFMFQRNKYNGRYFIPAFYSYSGGLFAIERFMFRKWQLETGLRFDAKQITSQYYRLGNYYEPIDRFSNWTYSLSSKWQIDSSNTLLLNSGVGWRAPSVAELYSRGIHHGSSTFEVGNADLKSERVYSFNVEHKYVRTYFETVVSAYIQYIPNYIYLVPDPINPVEVTTSGAWLKYNYEQIDATINGIDGNMIFKPNAAWSLAITGSLVEGRDVKNHHYLVNIPAARLKSTLTYAITTFKKWQHEFSIQGRQVFQKSNTDFQREIVVPPSAYLLLGCNYQLMKKINKSIWSLSLNIDNLANTTYRDYLDRFRFYADMPGRNITINLKYEFN